MRGWEKASKWAVLFFVLISIMPIGVCAKESIIDINNDGSLYDESHTSQSYDATALEYLNQLIEDTNLRLLCVQDIDGLFQSPSSKTLPEALMPTPTPSFGAEADGKSDANDEPYASQTPIVSAAQKLDTQEPGASAPTPEPSLPPTLLATPTPNATPLPSPKSDNETDKEKQPNDVDAQNDADTALSFTSTYAEGLSRISDKTLGDLVAEYEAAIQKDYIQGVVLSNVQVFEIKYQISIYLQALLDSNSLSQREIQQAEAVLINFEISNQLACQHASAILEYSTAHSGQRAYAFRESSAEEKYSKVLSVDKAADVSTMQTDSSNYLELLRRLNEANILLSDGLFLNTVDSDKDGITDGTELLNRMNPYRSDTDNDGLQDALEFLYYPRYSPLLADTDGDGTRDIDEDLDGDGLKNRDEQKNKTEMTINDTDGDGLLDGLEVHKFGSKPGAFDTDEDGLSDGDEYALKLNPNTRDTDGDGVLDSEERFWQALTTELASDEQSAVQAVTVSFSGTGNIETSTEIYTWGQRNPEDLNNQGVVGAPINIETRSEFDEATITFTYDDKALGEVDESNLVAVWFDEENGKYVVMPSIVDAEDNTVTFETPHFSTYFLYDKNSASDLSMLVMQPPIELLRDKVELVITMDSSWNMAGADPNDIRKTAACALVDGLSEQDYLGVVDYDLLGNEFPPVGLTHKLDLIKTTINSYNSAGTPFIHGNMLMSRSMIVNAHRFGSITESDNKKAIILLEGPGYFFHDPYYYQEINNEANNAKSFEIVYYVITLCVDDVINRTLMETVAITTEGMYFKAESAEELPAIFELILYDLIGGGFVEPIDVDGDGEDDAGTGYEDAAQRYYGDSASDSSRGDSGTPRKYYGEAYLAGDLSKKEILERLGLQDECASGFEPINFNTGGFFMQTEDAAFSNVPGMPTGILRTYNTQADEDDGPFGSGWAFDYNMHLKLYDSGDIGMINPDGHLSFFPKNADGTFADAMQDRQSLTKENGNYVVTLLEGTQYVFSSTGYLSKIISSNGNTDSITYNSKGLIEAVVLTDGRKITFTLNTDGHITAITLPGGAELGYAYENNRLVRFTDAAGNKTQYVYDEKGRMIEWVDAKGIRQVKNVYDDESRVIEQWDAKEGYYALEYGDGYTVTTDAEGAKNTFYYDEKGRSTKLVDAQGHTQSFEYNDFNLVTKYTDQVGKTTQYTYDDRGNLIKETHSDGRTREFTYDDENQMMGQSDFEGNWTAYAYDSAGNLIKQTDPDSSVYTFEYNEINQLVKEIGPLGHEVTYEYDGAQLVKLTDANGGETQNEYDGAGNLIATIDPEGNRTSFTYDALNQVTKTIMADDSTLRFAYDDVGNIVAVYDAYGVATKYEYDELGQLVKVINPDGSNTSYTYDKNGNLTQTVNPDGTTTQNTYDSNNNIVTAVSSTGDHYQYYYNPTGELIGVLDTADAFNYLGYDRETGRMAFSVNPEGAKTQYSYDANGNIVKVVYTDQSSVEYDYDVMGRVTTQTLADGSVTAYAYDALGRMIKQTDADGNETVYDYDAMGNLIKVTDACGSATLYKYNASGSLIQSIDAKGSRTEYAYDAVGQLRKITYPLGGVERIAYDKNGQIAKVVDILGASTMSTYDAMGRLVTSTDALGGEQTYAYDVMGNLTAQTNAVDAKVTYAYDAKGNLAGIEDALGGEAEYIYDTAGNLVSISAEGGFKQTYTYDKLGRVTRIVDSEGYETTYTYDKMGRLITESDNTGKAMSYAYDAVGQVKAIINALHQTTQLAYDQSGNVTKATYADGSSEKYTYDAMNRLLTMTDREGQITRYAYDANGNVTAVTLPGDIKTTYAYDAENNMVRQTAPDGSQTLYDYDKAGNLVRITDALGNRTKLTYNTAGLLTQVENAADETVLTVEYDVLGNIIAETDGLGNLTAYAYDAKNRLTAVTDPMGAVTKYIYDAADNLVGMIDANGNKTTYTYNTLGALTGETDALGNSERYAYKKVGLLASIKKPDGTTQSFMYDNAGRMIRSESSDGSQIAYAYNPIGAVTTLTDPAGTSQYQYNQRGQLTSYTDANDRTVKYAYDDLGRRSSITLPDGQTTDYTYDVMSRITEVKDKAGIVAEYTYNANGQVTENAREGMLTTYAYDELGQIASLVTYKADELLESYQYTYDAGGNILTERRETQSDTTHRTYSYDTNQRLTAMDEENHSEAYAYDAVGNITQKTMDGIDTAYSYNAANQLVTETQNHQTMEYTHNENGDLIAKSTGERYTYDVRGNLTAIKGNGINQQFTYDGAGNRLSKTVDGKTTEYLNDINLPYTQVLQTYGENGNLQNTYTYGIQRIKSEGLIDDVYLYDGRGSVSGVVTDTSQLVSYAYTAYGDLMPASPKPNAFGYNAEDMDDNTGLQYLRARYYNTKSGRFISKDAYKGDYTNPKTLNRYVYCAGNPVNRIDPSGHRTVEGAGGGIVTPQDRMPSFSKVYSIKQERNSLVSQFIPQSSVAQTDIFLWNDADFFCYHWFLDKGKLEIATKELAKIIDGLALWQIDNTTMMQTLQAILRVQDTNVTGWLDAKTVSNVENRLMAAGRDNSDPIYLSGEDIMAIYNSTDQKRSAREEWYISGGKEILTGVFILSTYVVYNKTKNFQVSGDVTSNYKEGTTRVGRWMSTDEYKKMISTNRVQESYTGTTHVAFPSNFDAYAKQAKPGSVYVEFSVPIDSVKSTGSGWAKIIGPGSLEGRYAAQNGLDIPQMPSAYDIILRGVK